MRGIARTLALTLLVVGAPLVPPAQQVEAAGEKPNLLFILTDDQRIGTLQVMPKTRARFDVVFPRSFVTTPLCCPARSSYLTGRNARHTKVLTNGDYRKFKPMQPDSIGPWLKARGYYTGFVGKYMNRYRVQDATPPGWDEFYALQWNKRGKRIGNGYTGFSLRQHEPGLPDRNIRYPNDARPNVYSTLYFGELATRFMNRANDHSVNPSGKPWALFLWPNAPHLPRKPHPRYRHTDVPSWNRPASFMEDLGDKPPQVTLSRQLKGPRTHLRIRRGQLRLLMTVDDMIAALFGNIAANGDTDSTWGFMSSDNGIFWGEHQLTGKSFAYEEAARVPLRMAVPGIGPRTLRSMVANVDIAPTMLELAGDTKNHDFDGHSLLGVIRGSAARVRTALLIEGWNPDRYRAARTARWKYIRWAAGQEELYDLRNDRYEMHNVVGERPRVHQRMRGVLNRLNRELSA